MYLLLFVILIIGSIITYMYVKKFQSTKTELDSKICELKSHISKGTETLKQVSMGTIDAVNNLQKISIKNEENKSAQIYEDNFIEYKHESEDLEQYENEPKQNGYYSSDKIVHHKQKEFINSEKEEILNSENNVYDVNNEQPLRPILDSKFPELKNHTQTEKDVNKKEVNDLKKEEDNFDKDNNEKENAVDNKKEEEKEYFNKKEEEKGDIDFNKKEENKIKEQTIGKISQYTLHELRKIATNNNIPISGKINGLNKSYNKIELYSFLVKHLNK